MVSGSDPPPYGEDVVLIKHECVGHVPKRKGTTLRKLKKSVLRMKWTYCDDPPKKGNIRQDIRTSSTIMPNLAHKIKSTW